MRYLAVVFATLIVLGCSSIVTPIMHLKPDYTTLPEQTVRDIALEIETAVLKGIRQPQIEDRDGIIINDPPIMQAIRTRAARHELVKNFLDTGHAYENDNGLIYIRRTKEYNREGTRKKRDRDAMLVMRENEDRWRIYEGIIRTSNLPPRALSAIQEIFHKARIANKNTE